MIQQIIMTEILCDCQDHQGLQVSSFCTRPRCRANSACCQKCIAQLHDRECLEQMTSIEVLPKIVSTLQNLEVAFDDFVLNVNQNFKEIKNTVHTILKPIKDYQMQPNLEKLNLLCYLIKMKPSNQIDQFINLSQKVINGELINLLENISLIKRKLKQPSITEYAEAENLFQESLILLKNQDYEQALCQIEKATDLVSNNEEYEYQKGFCLNWLSRQKEAVDQYNLSISIQPTVKAYFNKINSLSQLKQFEEAKACCEQGMAQFPNNMDLAYQLNFFTPKSFMKGQK